MLLPLLLSLATIRYDVFHVVKMMRLMLLAHISHTDLYCGHAKVVVAADTETETDRPFISTNRALVSGLVQFTGANPLSLFPCQQVSTHPHPF